MKPFAVAFAFVGIAASCAYCAVEESRYRKEERVFRAEFCGEQGGRWADGLFQPYCDFSAEAK